MRSLLLFLQLTACTTASTQPAGDSGRATDSGAAVDGGAADGGEATDTSDTSDTSDSGDPCTPTDELCNGIDDDCNGVVDDGDLDGDGSLSCDDCDDNDAFVSPAAPEACDGVDNDCSGAADEPWDDDGDGASECGGDCDDSDPGNSGTFEERCDGQDNNCDGEVDEGFDLDGDGVQTCDGDCDDTSADAYPGGVEVCDGDDNDCDPATDETVDADGDGLSTCDGDCDDSSATALPGGTETCDGVDNDCDGRTDDLPECWSCTTVGDYQVCTETATYDQAVAACDDFGLQLVAIGDAAENVTVAAAIGTVTSSAAYIGLTDSATEGTWLWVDGSTASWTNWNAGEPNDSGGEDCVHTNYGSVGGWNDIGCSSLYAFVCEAI